MPSWVQTSLKIGRIKKKMCLRSLNNHIKLSVNRATIPRSSTPPTAFTFSGLPGDNIIIIQKKSVKQQDGKFLCIPEISGSFKTTDKINVELYRVKLNTDRTAKQSLVCKSVAAALATIVKYCINKHVSFRTRLVSLQPFPSLSFSVVGFC